MAKDVSGFGERGRGEGEKGESEGRIGALKVRRIDRRGGGGRGDKDVEGGREEGTNGGRERRE